MSMSATSQTKPKTAVVTAPGQVEVREAPMPKPRPNEIRVKLEGCGVCASNIPPWEGREWFKYPFAPGAPGHEGWGVVEAIGEDVTNVRPGDRLAVLSYQAFSEYDIADASAVVPLPDSLRGKPFPGEALGCAFNVFKRCDIQPGHTVAIVGVGFLGAVLTALAANAGAYVIAITRRAFALDIARHYGAAVKVPDQRGPVRAPTGSHHKDTRPREIIPTTLQRTRKGRPDHSPSPRRIDLRLHPAQSASKSPARLTENRRRRT